MIEELVATHRLVREWPWSECYSNMVDAKAFLISESDYRNDVIYKEGVFGVFKPLLIEVTS